MTDQPAPIITTTPPEDICGGPVNVNGGDCAWCGASHEKVPVHGAGQLYPERCNKPWPDRPRRSVHPKMQQVMHMTIECWQCHAPTQFNSVNHPQHINAMMSSPNAVLHGQCDNCGAGVDIMHAKILKAAAPLMPGAPVIR